MKAKMNRCSPLRLIPSAPLLLSALSFPVQAIESNFNYSEIGVSISRTNFADSFRTLDGDKFDHLKSIGGGGQIKIPGGPYIGIGGGYGFNNQDNAEWRLHSLSGFTGIPVAVGSRVDFIGEIGYGWQQFESCIAGNCETESDTTVIYGVGARAWILPDILEAGLSLSDATISDSVMRTTLSAALWADANTRFALRYTDREGDGYTVGGGFAYSW